MTNKHDTPVTPVNHEAQPEQAQLSTAQKAGTSKQPKFPKATLGQKIKFWAFAVFFVVAVGGAITWNVTNSNKDNYIKTHGVKVTGTAQSEVLEREERRRRSNDTYFKARYDYVGKDGIKSSAIGEKKYQNKEDIKEGATADIYYIPDDPGKGTYVENEQ